MITKYPEVMHVELTSFQREIIATIYVESFITVIKENRTITNAEIEQLLQYLHDSIA